MASKNGFVLRHHKTQVTACDINGVEVRKGDIVKVVNLPERPIIGRVSSLEPGNMARIKIFKVMPASNFNYFHLEFCHDIQVLSESQAVLELMNI
jgi:hypothetical protein